MAPSRKGTSKVGHPGEGFVEDLDPKQQGLPMASSGTLARLPDLGKTMQTTTELLDLELVFSQQQLLTVGEFEAECQRRGLDFLSGQSQLEALHRAGALIPLYRAAKDVRAVLAQARRSDGQGIPPAVALRYVSTSARKLRADREARRLHDPRTEPYRPWRRYQRIFGRSRRWTSEFLYSPYQLLLIPKLAPLMPYMRQRRLGPGRYRFWLPKTELRLGTARKDAERNTALVMALTAIEAAYRPPIVQRLTSPRDIDDRTIDWWQDYRDAFDPAAVLDWISWDTARVKAAAEQLAVQADLVDPLRDWIELVRLLRPEKWAQLRGDALVALDHRIAAEMLWCCYEDLITTATTAPSEPFPGHRLRANPEALDAVLMDFGLSPHPALVFMVEGETERTLVPRVLDLLGVPRWPSRIQLVDMGGIDTKLDLLAAYAATPQLGESLESSILLTRPLTRFLVAVDPEKAYATGQQREQVRTRLVDKMLTHLSAQDRTPMIRQQLEELVSVETWGTKSFEFAHFSNDEIARAILQVSMAM